MSLLQGFVTLNLILIFTIIKLFKECLFAVETKLNFFFFLTFTCFFLKKKGKSGNSWREKGIFSLGQNVTRQSRRTCPMIECFSGFVLKPVNHFLCTDSDTGCPVDISKKKKSNIFMQHVNKFFLSRSKQLIFPVALFERKIHVLSLFFIIISCYVMALIYSALIKDNLYIVTFFPFVIFFIRFYMFQFCRR